MNLTIMCGRCTRDAEVRYSTSGMGVARFTLAIDRPKKDEQEQTADFISCVAFGKLQSLQRSSLRRVQS